MFIELSIQVFFALLMLFIYWLMPSLMPAGVPFGVRVPPNHQEDAFISQVRRDYHISLVVIAIVIIAGGILLQQIAPSFWFIPGTLITTFLLTGLDYYIAHQRLAHLKQREDWFAGQRQAIAVDTNIHREQIHLPAIWLILTIVLVAAMFVIGTIVYPSLPESIATHFTSDGTPNQWMAKNIGTFLIPVIALITTIMFVLLARFLPSGRAQLDPADIDASRARYHKLRKVWGTYLLVVSALTNLMLLTASLTIWQILPTGSLVFLTGLFAPIIIIVALLVILTLNYRRTDKQPHSSNGQTGYVARDDDRYWKGGMFYFNREDPSIFVEKRFGIGWTVNFGHPAGMIFTVIVLVIVVGSLSLAMFVR